MKSCLKSLTLLAALPLCFAAMSQEAAAEDRFEVKLEEVNFRANLDTDPSGYVVRYTYAFSFEIEGRGLKLAQHGLITRPKQMTPIAGYRTVFQVEEPKRKHRQIKLSAETTGKYQETVDSPMKTQDLGKAAGATERDLFDEADDADDDKAVEIVHVKNGDFEFYVRVTVTKID